MLDKEEILEYLRTEIKPQLDEDGVINFGLFGSFAKGTATEESDIDICLESTDVFREKYPLFEHFIYLEKLREKISKRFNRSVDIANTVSTKDWRKKRILRGVIYI